MPMMDRDKRNELPQLEVCIFTYYMYAYLPITGMHIYLLQVCINQFITYEEQLKNGHIYGPISHICHTKILCPLGNFVACDWLS